MSATFVKSPARGLALAVLGALAIGVESRGQAPARRPGSYRLGIYASAVELEERTQMPAAAEPGARGHRRQPRDARAAQQLDQDRLELVVAVVRGQ